MDKLISAVFDNSEQSCALKELGHCMAFLVADDFTTRIFPSSSQNNLSLEESISTPFFVLCRSAFSNTKPTWTLRPMALLVTISKFLEATGFLVLYFLRGKFKMRLNILFKCDLQLTITISPLIVTTIINNTGVSGGYTEFCSAAKRKLSKCLYDDLFMALTYDSEMFCFLLPSIFGDIATSGSFPVTGNIDLIRLVVSAVDPISLQELICMCLTNTAKVINKEDVLPLIGKCCFQNHADQYKLLLDYQLINKSLNFYHLSL